MNMKTKIVNLQYRDPEGKDASAYIVRAWFADGDYADGLYCANTKEYAFRQCRDDWARCRPERKIEELELIGIDAGIRDGKRIV